MNVLLRVRVTTLLLTLTAFGSGLVAWWPQPPSQQFESSSRPRHLLRSYDPERIVKIELRRGDSRTVMERAALDEAVRGGRFVLTQPLETDADDAAVDKLLSTLRYATWVREVPVAKVSPGAQEIEISTDTERVRFALGPASVTPKGSYYLVMDIRPRDAELNAPPTDSRMFVVSERLAKELFVDPQEFRGRQLVPYQKSSIERLVLSSAAGTRRMVATDGVFHFDQMEDGQRVERRGLDRIFLSFARSVADPFVDMEVAREAIEVQATVRVSLRSTDPNKPEASLQFGGECPGQPGKALVVRHSPEPLAGCVPHRVVAPLREPAEALIDRGLFSLSRDEVDTVRIVSGAQTTTLLRRGSGFELRTSTAGQEESSVSGLEVRASVGEDRIRRILALRGDLLAGRDRPRNAEKFRHALVTLESSAVPGRDRVIEEIAVSKPRKSGAVYVHRRADGAVLTLGASAELALRADATLLKPLKVLEYSARAVQQVIIQRAGRGVATQRLVRNPDGRFELEAPKGYPVDVGLAEQLVAQLSDLEAVRWITDVPTKGFGLTKPRATVTLVVDEENESVRRKLRIGSEAPGGYYATIDGNPGVFVISRAAFRGIDTWLVSRAEFRLERDRLLEVSVTFGRKRPVVIRRIAGELSIVSAPDAFDRENLQPLLSALEGLTAEAAVHLGKPERGEGLRRPLLQVSAKSRSRSGVRLSRLRYAIGSRDTFHDASVYYARLRSTKATFALPRRQVQSLLDLY